MTKDPQRSLLCVANVKSDRGYAWNLIGGFYANIANHLAMHGIRTLVSYPSIPSPPKMLAGSAARPVLLDGSLQSSDSVNAMIDLIRRENIRAIYFTDREAMDPTYWRLRRAGIKYIVNHDHSSGERTKPRFLKKATKYALARIPPLVPDVIIAVSDYVARRQTEVSMIPAERVVRIWNGLPLPALEETTNIRGELGISEDTPVIVCACRATPEKGVQHLFRAFSSTLRELDPHISPVLIYAGDGPMLHELKALRDHLPAKRNILILGYRNDVQELIRAGDLCVVPSLWQEAFGMSVLEPMAFAKPVVATKVGGIPELVEDGVTGCLVSPGDESTLSKAILELLTNPTKATNMGVAARERVAKQFAPERQISQLISVIERGFGFDCFGSRECP
ncbi:MAG: glycosyltransferase family 4 protein [Terriglobia bacterium]|nr:glycosyltransferase family 4 protein [Terriglobia bacterium]